MIKRLLPEYLPSDWPDDVPFPKLNEWEAALQQDRMFDQVVIAGKRCVVTLPSEESVAIGNAYIAEGRARGNALMLLRIANQELITALEMRDALRCSEPDLIDAIRSKKIFQLIAINGINYYPAFFCDKDLDWQSVGAIAQQLAELPASTQYHFFTSRCSMLNGLTPLEALRSGKMEEVRSAAICYLAN